MGIPLESVPFEEVSYNAKVEVTKNGMLHIMFGAPDDNCEVCKAIAAGKDPGDAILEALKEKEA